MSHVCTFSAVCSLMFVIECSGVITESSEIILLGGMQMLGDHLLGRRVAKLCGLW